MSEPSEYEIAVAEWALRHDIRASQSDLRAAFDDARTLAIEGTESIGVGQPNSEKRPTTSGSTIERMAEAIESVLESTEGEYWAEAAEQILSEYRTSSPEISQETARELLDSARFVLKFDGKKLGSIGEGSLQISIARAEAELDGNPSANQWLHKQRLQNQKPLVSKGDVTT
jgi:hypothetical protein